MEVQFIQPKKASKQINICNLSYIFAIIPINGRNSQF